MDTLTETVEAPTLEEAKPRISAMEIDPTALLPIPGVEVVANSPIRSFHVKITPEWAAAMLTHRKHQRPVSRTFVDKYERDMAAGRWLVSGEPLILSGVTRTDVENGYLMLRDALGGFTEIEGEDLQHRLIACVEADAPFETLLVTGVDGPAIRKLLDQGKSRTLTDVLNYADELGVERGRVTWRVLKDATVKMMMVEQHWNGEKPITPTSTEMLQWLHDHIEMVESVQLAESFRELLPKKATPALVAMTGYHLRQVYDPEAQEEFVTSFATLVELPTGHPYLVVRPILEQLATKRREVKVTWKDAFRVIMNAARYATEQSWPVREAQIRSKPKRGSLPEPITPALQAVA